MGRAFTSQGLPPPGRAETLSIVGLSLPVAMARLAPDRPDLTDALVAEYKAAFAALRGADDPIALSPLYPGARAALEGLAAQDEVFLGIATGKSRRGLDHVFDLHGFETLFHALHCADDHPSKPHPSMVEACLRDTGVEAAQAVIIGDTVFDMEMGQAAGIRCIGVDWGYHPASDLMACGADRVLSHFDELPGALSEIWGNA
jgi:phosphoglycolate phosphatase